MTTPNLDPAEKRIVVGKPRKVTEYPKTIWDKEDIAAFKEQIKRHPAAKEAYDGIVAFAEKAVAKKMEVPVHSDDPGKGHNTGGQWTKVTSGIANLGIAYQLSGREEFAEEAKRILLLLADRYEGWERHAHPKFTHDNAKWSWQRLNEGIWIIPSAWGFDLIHNSKCLSDEERQKIKEHFMIPCANSIMKSASIIAAPTNWSVICNAGVMMAARVSDHEELYRKTIDGLGGKKRSKNPDARPMNNGGMYYHLDSGIDDDGMWAEGAIGYQMMAIRGLLVCAEVMWRDGIDVYSYRNGRLKLVFDSPIWYHYPGGKAAPAVHDSGSSNIFGRDAHLYGYALRRYGDKTYNAILSKVTPTFESVYNLFLPACDFAPVDATDMPEIPSILFPGVGFTIAQTGDGEESKYFFMDYGPNRSHGHADKLNFNLFALGQELFADGGSAWYSTDVYQRYYPHSFAHNTLSANQTSQIRTGGKLLAYGSLGDMAITRAMTDTAIPSTALDRTMFLSDGRLYDIFMVKGGLPFTLDLMYHSHGLKMEQTVATEAWKEWPKESKGYCYFDEPLSGKTDSDWNATWIVKNGSVKMSYIGEKDTEVIVTKTPKAAVKLPTVMVRRVGKATVYSGVMDVIAGNAGETVASLRKIAVANEAGAGIDCVLKDGCREVLLANFTGGTLTYGEFTTDAQTAFLKFKGKVLTDLYLAGATTLQGPGLKISSDSPALLAMDTVKEGLATLTNQSEKPARVTISGATIPGKVIVLDREGKRSSENAPEITGTAFSVALPARSSVELVKGAQPSVADYKAGIRKKKLAIVIEKERITRENFEKMVKQQYADAKAAGVSENFFALMQAEKPVAEEGGKISVTSKKAATLGDAFSMWNNHNHALEYEFEVPKDGNYQVIIKYCREGAAVKRSVEINGAGPEGADKVMEMPGTGGWSNGADNWKLYTLKWPLVEKPYLWKLKAGKHKLRLTNIGGGGLNLDYIVIAAPFMEATKKGFEK